ncbi:MAG: mechanosensitive ion channel family protein [Alphaproteobacteria bacterium]|nr:MAG: mechanosensitive ion channel family protein [Alphaproteobacteria bacterium]
MNDSVQAAIDQVIAIAATYGLNVVAAIVILVIGLWFAGWSKRTVQRLLNRRENMDLMLSGFLSSLVKYLVIAFTLIAVLGKFGVQTASLITVLGAAGLAIGLALQGTLSNVAAGVMLLIFRPFKVGDYVDAGGIAGTVKDVTLFTCELSTPDNVQITVPNAQIWGNAIKNFSGYATRRVDVAVGISYGDNIDAAFQAVKDTIAADGRIHKTPEPLVAVSDLGDSSVNLVVRVWTDASNYWPVKFDLTKAIKEKLDASGIEIPFPQRVVHLQKEAAE